MNEPNIEELSQAIRADSNLTEAQKQAVIEKLSDVNFRNKLMYGGLGAGLAALIGKFLGLSTQAKIIVALAGFGIGEIIFKKTELDKNRFATYNKETHLYEIK